MAVTRVYGLHPAADPVLRNGGLCQNEPATLVSAPLSTLLSTKPSTNPRFTYRSIPDPSGGPSATPSVTDQSILHRMARAHLSHIFQPNLLQHHQARVHSKNSNRNPEHIPELGSIHISQPCILPLDRAQVQLKNSEETPISCPKFFSIPFFEY